MAEPHSKKSIAVVHAGSLRTQDWLRFVQIPPFPTRWSRLGLDERALEALEVLIMAAPKGGDVIPGSHGLRKGRFGLKGRAKGKRSGYRVFYVYLEDYGTVLLIAIIYKTQESDLTRADIAEIEPVIQRIRSYLKSGRIR